MKRPDGTWRHSYTNILKVEGLRENGCEVPPIRGGGGSRGGSPRLAKLHPFIYKSNCQGLQLILIYAALQRPSLSPLGHLDAVSPFS